MPDSGDNANDRLGGRKLEIFSERSRNSNSLNLALDRIVMDKAPDFHFTLNQDGLNGEVSVLPKEAK